MAGTRDDAMLIVELSKLGAMMRLDEAARTVFADDFDPDGVDHLVVALRAAGLDDRRHARVQRELRPVREREERVAREGGAAELVAVLARLVERDPHRVDAAHLPGADADRPAVLGDDDRV